MIVFWCLVLCKNFLREDLEFRLSSINGNLYSENVLVINHDSFRNIQHDPLTTTDVVLVGQRF